MEAAKRQAADISNAILFALNDMMVQGTIETRDSYLKAMESLDGISEIRIIRGDSVIEQYGEGLESEKPKDEMDLRVLSSGNPEFMIEESAQGSLYRAAIPFKMTRELVERTGIECFDCHDGGEGNVNGALSLTMPLAKAEESIAKNGRRMAGFYVVELLIILLFFFWVIRSKVNLVLENIISLLHSASDNVFGAADDIAESSDSLAEGATEQAAALEETSASLEQLASRPSRTPIIRKTLTT
ncbi:MAG: hypothetical protein V3S46_09045 [Nitrospinota bacterium]